MDTMTIILTYILLVVSFGSVFLTIKHKSTKKNVFLIIGLLISAFPITYALYDDFKNNYVDANIGLGLAFFLTLGIIGVLFLVAFIKYFRLRRK
jgi:Kef-type K+ transport system membrane component KefB